MTAISESRPEAIARQSLREKTYPRQQFLTYQRRIMGEDATGPMPEGTDPDQPLTFERWLSETRGPGAARATG